MAKKETTRTSIDDINESLTTFETKVVANKKPILTAIGVIIVVALLALGYYYFIHAPKVEQSKEAIAKADLELSLGNDSVALQQYKNVVSDLNTSESNRAALNAAILLFQDKKYDEAITYLNKYDAKGEIVGPASQSLLGDCYVNLSKYDEALKAFDKAISLSNENALYTPLFMIKKAVVYREQQNFKAEAEIYETIKTKYPEFSIKYQTDVEKYLERAKAQSTN